MVGYNAFVTAAPLIDKMVCIFVSGLFLYKTQFSQVVVKEEWIAIAILRLIELEKCVVEGAGAAGLAAILAGHLDEFKGKRFGIIKPKS